MASTTKTAVNPLQLLGGLALLGGSITLFFHRLPKREYVEVIADKQRPKKEGEISGTSTAAAQAAMPIIVAAAPKKAPPRPAVTPTPAGLATIGGTESPVKLAAVDWRDACRSEIGILCNHIRSNRLRRCLDQYQDVWLGDCRRALLGREDVNPDSF